jgi:hypothetical protein
MGEEEGGDGSTTPMCVYVYVCVNVCERGKYRERKRGIGVGSYHQKSKVA